MEAAQKNTRISNTVHTRIVLLGWDPNRSCHHPGSYASSCPGQHLTDEERGTPLRPIRTLDTNMCGIPAHSIGIEIHCKCLSTCGHELYEFTHVSGVQQSSSSKVKRMPQSLASTLQLCIDCWLFCLDALLPK